MSHLGAPARAKKSSPTYPSSSRTKPSLDEGRVELRECPDNGLDPYFVCFPPATLGDAPCTPDIFCTSSTEQRHGNGQALDHKRIGPPDVTKHKLWLFFAESTTIHPIVGLVTPRTMARTAELMAQYQNGSCQ